MYVKHIALYLGKIITTLKQKYSLSSHYTVKYIISYPFYDLLYRQSVAYSRQQTHSGDFGLKQRFVLASIEHVARINTAMCNTFRNGLTVAILRVLYYQYHCSNQRNPPGGDEKQLLRAFQECVH